jgi:2,3-bisphosphoglycerate-independent phosphoglycerate mutase
MAKKPNTDRIMSAYPYVTGGASGLDVGLPDGQMGNSEVGHLNIGAGRVVYQELTKISKEIEEGEFFENKALLDAVENCKKHDSAIHFYGLVSDGGVHSHNTHLYALLRLARVHGLTKVYVHAFLDGRDTPPASGKGYIEELEAQMEEIGVGKIAVVSGRYYAMDRDKRWDRVELAYNAMVLGQGELETSAVNAVTHSYEKGPTFYDEFVHPAVICESGGPVATVKENDSIVCFNFRPDRARELTRAFTDPAFDGFKRANGYFKVFCVCFTEIDVTIPNKEVAFEVKPPENTIGEYISSLGLKQLRLAETEKYAHVTFFFNGGIEKEYDGESRILIPSPKVATYDLMPEMSAYGVSEALVKSILSKEFDLIIINFANSDMVGHTGIIPAAVKAVETVDECVGKAYDAVIATDAQMFICADHGNSDQMIDYETGEPFTAHTTNPVPFILVNCKKANGLKTGGKLCDISPTLLDMMGIAKPSEMKGESLLIKN